MYLVSIILYQLCLFYNWHQFALSIMLILSHYIDLNLQNYKPKVFISRYDVGIGTVFKFLPKQLENHKKIDETMFFTKGKHNTMGQGLLNKNKQGELYDFTSFLPAKSIQLECRASLRRLISKFGFAKASRVSTAIHLKRNSYNEREIERVNR